MPLLSFYKIMKCFKFVVSMYLRVLCSLDTSLPILICSFKQVFPSNIHCLTIQYLWRKQAANNFGIAWMTNFKYHKGLCINRGKKILSNIDMNKTKIWISISFIWKMTISLLIKIISLLNLLFKMATSVICRNTIWCQVVVMW